MQSRLLKPLSTHWIGTAGGDETVRLLFSENRVVVNYVSTTTEKAAGGPLPDETVVTCRLPQGTFQGSFKPKAWPQKVSLILKRTRSDANGYLLPKTEIGCVVDREWKGKGGNFSVFRLFPLDTPRFQSRTRYVGNSSDRELSSFTPKLEIRGGYVHFEARAHVNGIDRATDIAIVCDFSNGQAFGLVRGARWAKGIVRIPLHFLSDKKSAKPSCVVGVNGNFDFAPDSMASSPAFHFNVIEYSITCVLPQRAAFC